MIDFSSSQNNECGVEYESPGRIVGGKKLKKHEAPWKVAMFRNDLHIGIDKFEYACGGVLISDETVVTGKKTKITFPIKTWN
jgi:Trypsin